METEPNLSSTSQGMVVALWSREEGSTHWSVPKWMKKHCNYEKTKATERMKANAEVNTIKGCEKKDKVKRKGHTRWQEV